MTFITRENHLTRLFCFPGNKGRIHFADTALLSAEAATDTRFNHAHHGFGDMQRIGNNAAAVENNLRRAEDIQTAVGINGAIGYERLHHILLYSLGMSCLVDNNIAFRQNLINLAILDNLMGTQVALIVGTNRAVSLPGILGMHEHRVIQRSAEVKHCIQHLIFYFNQRQRLVNSLFRFAGNNRYDITHKAYMTVQQQAVVGTRLGISLACIGAALAVLVYVLPGINCFDIRHLRCNCGVNAFNNSICMRRTQHLDKQAVVRHQIIGVDRLACHQLHSILFAVGLVNYFHLQLPSLCLRLSFFPGDEILDSAQLSLIAGATAQVACQKFLDFFFSRLAVFTQQRDSVHNHTGVAEAALLRALVGNKGTELRCLLLHSLHRYDAVACGTRSQDSTGKHRLIVHKYSAQAAVGSVATALHAVAAFLAQKIE